MRVNTSLLAICIVDAWKLYASAKGYGSGMSPNQLYCELADQLIDNKYDRISSRQRESDIAVEDEDIGFGSGIGTRLIPTTRKRKNASEEENCALYQSRCNIFKGRRKSKFICWACSSILTKKYTFVITRPGVTALRNISTNVTILLAKVSTPITVINVVQVIYEARF